MSYRELATALLHELALHESCETTLLPIISHLFPPYLVKAIIRYDPSDVIVTVEKVLFLFLAPTDIAYLII